MKTNKKWTAEEERVLTEQVTKYSINLSRAFRTAASLINRSESACRVHWYTVIIKREDTTTCFVTIGRKTKNVNRKIVTASTSDNTQKVSAAWWKKLLNLLGMKK